MNVSSGTSSPGQTQTKGRKTVVCVRVTSFSSRQYIMGATAPDGVAWSVCVLVTTISLAKTAELINMSLRVWTCEAQVTTY